MEAHGTGTPVGDPIEAKAIGHVLGEGRPAHRPCVVGSVKTNIGHLEAGSGMAGLIKAALALKHRQIPANLHFEIPHAEIPFEALKLRIPQSLEPWPECDGPALAGVNSFGFGGTNAHVVLEEPPRLPSEPAARARVDRAALPGVHGAAARSGAAQLIPISARSLEAIQATVGRFREYLAESGNSVSLEDIAYTAALRRTHHDCRLTAVADSKKVLDEQLQAFLDAAPGADASFGRAAGDERPRMAFVCSGQGPQWWAMGRQLLAGEPVFREMIEACDEIIRRLGDWSLLEELTADEGLSRMHETAIAQPALFALQAALAALWHSWGIEPDVLIGHSVGEVAAAYLAGVVYFGRRSPRDLSSGPLDGSRRLGRPHVSRGPDV